MRSLTLTTAATASISDVIPDGGIAAVAVDSDDGTVYVAHERVDPDGEQGVKVEIVALKSGPGGRYDGDSIASFSSPVVAPFELPSYRSQVVDLHYFADDRSLVVLLAGGDIGTMRLDQSNGGMLEVDIVGSVDSGIKAAAWSPDDEQLVLVTGEDMLVCMTRMFDLIHEEPLRKDEFGEDAFINVGWGSKSTQFHGSLGKTAASSTPAASSSSSTPPSLSHPTDDGLPTITFRGDCAYFAISSLDTYPSSPSHARRQVRIYSRDASAGFVPKLSATSESLPGLEGPLCWRPSGNLISGLVRYGYEGGGEGREGKWDVAMLERNGLRHGGFGLREEMEVWEEGRVRGLRWSGDSEVLAVWVERPEGDVVQLWTMKNYHYYLKQEIYPSVSTDQRFKGVQWHPEQPLTLYLYTAEHVQVHKYNWDTHVARLPEPNDTSTVAVIDGNKILITPFRTQNTPPPMASYTLPVPSSAKHLSLSHTLDALAVLLSDGLVQVYDLHTRLPQKGQRRTGGKAAEPKMRYEVRVGEAEGLVLKQVCMAGEGLAVLANEVNGKGGSVIVTYESGKEVGRDACEEDIQRVLWDEELGYLLLEESGVLSTLSTGEALTTLPASPTSLALSPSTPSCPSLAFALSPSGKLITSTLSSPSSTHTLSTGVTSFVLSPDFLIYTTSSQYSHYAPLPVVFATLDGQDVPAYQTEWETRRVERGALLVAASASEMSLVMQMPRGNLETVYPRPLVLAEVRREVLAGEYRQAFLKCRKHRLDLNVLYDLDPAAFMRNLEEFTKQVSEVDYLNLFVSSLSDIDSSKALFRDIARDDRKTVPTDKVNAVCDALREILEKDVVRYIETILTTHVCKRPADYEAGLRVLHKLQADHADIVEDAIKYIIFLSDVNQLYDVALGMYDFQLVLMVAQYSQKDPKEYLPFLRELRALDKYDQRFRIDDHLERRASALRNLIAAGEDKWEDASSYMARYELFDVGFELCREDKNKLAVVHDLYGDYLYDRKEFLDAATSFLLASKHSKALKAYEKAHAWRELFSLAIEQKVSDDVMSGLNERVSDHLASRGKPIEASRILVEYARDVDAAVDVLCRGAEFAEAYRLCASHDRADLVSGVVQPGLEEAHEALGEVFEEMEGQLDKEIERIRELLRVKQDDPDSFFLVDREPDLEGVDVATNATTAVTNFTRYTVAPTTVMTQSTHMTGKTNKTRTKASRRRQAGRKGTVDEWDYLIQSLGRLVIRVDEKSAEAVPLVRFLLLADGLATSARDLQDTVVSLRAKLNKALDEAWKDRPAVLREAEESGGMGFQGDTTAAKALEKPVVVAWRGLGPLAG